MKRINISVLFVTLVLATAFSAMAENAEPARSLIGRVLPGKADLFVVEMLPQTETGDVFEIESAGDKIVLRGTSGVAVASALNWYLKHYCSANLSWRGRQATLPEVLPPVSPKLRKETPLDWRYCFNYCCFSYSMAWWDWEDWEWAIDWMALNGINMPLAVTGQESVWLEVGRSFGLTDAELDEFFVGTAYLPFGWMGCIDGWGGPLSREWIKQHAALGKRILQRERELGMKPVLQGFTGHVPAALKAKFPEAKFQQLPSWCDFPGTTFIDPNDPMFVKFGKAFIEEQTRQFGTNNFYAADTFIEMPPPSNEPTFLDAMGKAVFGAMQAGDPNAVWIMQSWMFLHNAHFWQPPQTKALLNSVRDDQLIVLDLQCESRPAWKLTESFSGKPWIWCIIQDFGDVVSMHGGLPQIAEGLVSALNAPERGKLRGAGFIMEGMGYNPVVQDLMSDIFWSPEKKEMKTWITAYAQQRYGKHLKATEQAWQGLLDAVYSYPGRGDSVVCKRPALVPHKLQGTDKLSQLAAVWDVLTDCASELQDVDTYQYDLVNVARQALSELAGIYHGRLMASFEKGENERFQNEARAYLELLDDMDALLATRQEFLLGRWIADAKRWGGNDAEKELLEWNARNQITLWGPKDSRLHDYAQKQWSGLIEGFYRPRWERFFNTLSECLDKGVKFDAATYEADIRTWEEAWTKQNQPYPDKPAGDPVAVASRLWEKYRSKME